MISAYALRIPPIGREGHKLEKPKVWDCAELTYGNLMDVGECCERNLLIVVSELVQRSKKSSAVHKLEGLVQGLFRRELRSHRSPITQSFQAVWSDGAELASNVVLGSVEVPSLLLLNVSSQQFSLPPVPTAELTEESLRHWLLQASEGDVSWYGGKGFLRRVRRAGWDIYTTLWLMFSTQPLLSLCLFGLPTGILSIICYTLCSVDMSAETQDLYRDSDEEDLSDHQKRE